MFYQISTPIIYVLIRFSKYINTLLQNPKDGIQDELKTITVTFGNKQFFLKQ